MISEKVPLFHKKKLPGRCQQERMSEYRHGNNRPKIRTPLTLARIALLFFLAAVSFSGWLRVTQAAAYRDWFETLPHLPGQTYFIISGTLCGALFLAALAGVFFQIKGAGWFTIGLAVSLSAWRWIERIVFARSDITNAGWVFEAAVNAALLVIVFMMMKNFPPITSDN